MNRQQLTAYGDPCFLSIETMRPKFRHVDGAWSIVLTINSGYE